MKPGMAPTARSMAFVSPWNPAMPAPMAKPEASVFPRSFAERLTFPRPLSMDLRVCERLSFALMMTCSEDVA